MEFSPNVTSLDALVISFVDSYKKSIIASGHSASGQLARETTGVIKFDGVYLKVILELPKQGIFIENGTRPHFPPVDAILKWIKVKPVLPRALPNGKLPTEKQLAFLIARKISQVGTKPTHLIRDTLSSFNLKGKLIKEIQKQYIKYVKEQIDSKSI